MKSAPVLAVFLFEVGLAAAGYIKDGMYFEEPAAEVKDLAPRQILGCLFQYPLPPGQIQTSVDPNFNILSYCTEFLKPTKATVTKTSKTTNYVTITTSATTTVGKTVTTTLPGTGTTTTALCPIPTPGQNCGVKGWGYAVNNIYTGSDISSTACNQLCLGNAQCRSYQVQDPTEPAPQCNLYSVDASANNTIPGSSAPFTFYDRGCPDVAPAGCKGRVARDAMVTARADLADAAPSPPFWLTAFAPETVSEICGCILDIDIIPGNGGPAVTKTVYSTTVASTIITKATTAFATVTTTVGGGSGFVTSYVSVKKH